MIKKMLGRAPHIYFRLSWLLLCPVLVLVRSHAGAGEVPEDFKLMSLSDVSVDSSEAASLEDLFHQQNLNFLLLCWTFHSFYIVDLDANPTAV